MYTISLTVQQLKTISEALVRMPYMSVVDLIAEINRQIQQQDKNGGDENGND